MPWEVSISGGLVILLLTDSCNDCKYKLKTSLTVAGLEVLRMLVRTNIVSDEIGLRKTVITLSRFSSVNVDMSCIFIVQ